MDVTDNRAESRFELATDDGPAVAVYERNGGVITFTHTVVPEGEEGHGIGSRLVAGALTQVRAEGLKVVPQCPFVAAYIEGHSEWQDLLA